MSSPKFYTSWRYWYTRDKLKQNNYKCDTCQDEQEVMPPDLSFKIYCHCAMLQWQRKVESKYYSIQSLCPPTFISGLDVPVDNQRISDNFKKVLERMEQFNSNPVGWMLLMGTFGTGKTHILRSIRTQIPVSLYLECTEFQNAIFDRLNTGGLSDYINLIKRAPVLLLDDIGLQWKNEFTLQKLLDVINFRCAYPHEFPTIATTNFFLDSIQIQRGQSMTKGRFWSRMTDKAIVEIVPVLANDYRNRRST